MDVAPAVPVIIVEFVNCNEPKFVVFDRPPLPRLTIVLFVMYWLMYEPFEIYAVFVRSIYELFIITLPTLVPALAEINEEVVLIVDLIYELLI